MTRLSRLSRQILLLLSSMRVGVVPHVSGGIISSNVDTTSFSPMDLFASSENGFWLDPSDLSTLWQDTGGTMPAVVGNPVGRIDDKSGNGNNALQSTAANRPILRQDADGAYYLEFDGSNDTLSVTVATSQPWTSIYGFQFVSGATITDGNSASERLALYVTTGTYKLFDGAERVTLIANHTEKEWLVIGFNGSSTYFGGRNGLTGPITFGATEAPTGIILGAACNSTNHAQMRVYQAISVNRSITFAERILARSWIYRSSLIADYPNQLVVCDGNSLTAGYGGADNYPALLAAMLPSGALNRNYGASSQTTADMSSDAATQVDNNLRAYTGAATLIAWETTNDIYFGADLATCQSRFQAYFNARIAAGWRDSGNKLVAMTLTARGNFPDQPGMSVILDNFNIWLRANYATYATHLVDLAADARLSDFNNTTYFQADKVHLTNAGSTVVAGLVYAAVFT